MRKREVFKKQEAVCWKNKGGAGKVGFPGFMVENGRAMIPVDYHKNPKNIFSHH